MGDERSVWVITSRYFEIKQSFRWPHFDQCYPSEKIPVLSPDLNTTVTENHTVTFKSDCCHVCLTREDGGKISVTQLQHAYHKVLIICVIKETRICNSLKTVLRFKSSSVLLQNECLISPYKSQCLCRRGLDPDRHKKTDRKVSARLQNKCFTSWNTLPCYLDPTCLSSI